MSLHMITKSPAVRVPPNSTTPIVALPLSSIDRCTAGRMSIDSVTVFTHGVKAAKRIRDALAKALVLYYPVAGKITEINLGEPEVNCTGEGIWFVEAKANCSLEEVNYLERPLMIPKEQLLPQPPLEANLQDEILLVQVTEFICGGFTIGICSSHLVFDGQGFAQFLKAVGEMASGLPEPTVKPVWSRENIPAPPKALHAGPPLSFTVFNFTTSVVDISLDSISRIKVMYMAETGQRSSTFDVVTAMIFKCRARAIDLAPEADIRMGFAASTRHLLHGVLPSVEGYYGNCLYPIGIAKSCEEINKASLVTVMSIIKGAKETLSTKFKDWMYGCTESYYNMPLDYGTMVVSDWSKVGLNEVDFGWGQPRYVFPLNDDLDIIASGIYLKPPVPKTGIRLILRCVKEEHSAVFREELSKMA
ncbi:HXXXD-type acyl-transferase family protein [Rhynchospora pubera]|uniref:HXXXD-type acyl-transferase family protein n=1 Tax=Rhynchospora pubera TaxID=906938 RepID=A0AAV8G4U5_9POAL|nr:HXXXD-type acyl-transferase family protein [Rhynchospora pubera]